MCRTVWVGWHKAGLELSSRTGLVPAPSLPALPPGQALHHPPSFPKLSSQPPPLGQRDGGRRKTKTDTGGTHRRGAPGLQWQWVTFGFWRAFPPPSSQLLTCSCCCSSPSAPDQRPVTTKRHSGLLTRSCSQVTICPQTGRPGRPGCQSGKEWRSRKGKPPRKMAVCFQLASRQGREGHVHQSIEDHPPIRVRVSASSSNEELSFRARLLLSRTGPWLAGRRLYLPKQSAGLAS